MTPSETLGRIATDTLRDGTHANACDRGYAAEALLVDQCARLDRRARLFMFLVTWATVLAIATVAMCSGCASLQAKRTVAEEHTSAVVISGACPMQLAPGIVAMVEFPRGSGVRISPTHVLTAYHVVDEPACMYFATDWTGEKTLITVEKAWKPYDVARLVAPFKVDPPTLGVATVPAPGGRVCVVSAIPRTTRRCGDVQFYRDDPPGEIRHTAVTEPGNSGSGVYDEAGRLVGIVTHLLGCSNGQICGGKFAELRSEFFQ